ncbi:MAG: porin family protein [Gemmatimonadetes bacterium]|nr:porin family protein [Gemmatimonadota bacterium]
MNRFVRASFTVVAAALVFTASDAQAQMGFSIAGGPSIATGDFGEGLDMGYHLKGALGFSVPMLPIGLEADAMWTRFNASDIDDSHMQILSGTLNAVVNLPTPGITPYLIGGVGMYNGKATIMGESGDGETDFGFNVGAGVRMGLVGLGGVFAEARLHNVLGDGETARFIPISLGIRF